MRPSLALATAGALLTPLAASGVAAAVDVPSPGDRAAAAGVEHRSEAATAALARAQAIFDAHHPEHARAVADRGHEATLALRDLLAVRDDLSADDRREADRLLARPTDGASDPQGDGYTVAEQTPVCGTNVCVHYVTSTVDAIDPTDGPDDGAIPDVVDNVLATLETVHATYAAAGYREPKPDGVLGGNALTDVYLANIGDDSLYGYCASDDPGSPNTWDRWAYCVLDNDYSPAEFPNNTPLENLQVTIAHEYFHAVQFAYDTFEDGWFMEATATWVEDELFDDVNDNVGYLPAGQLGKPSIPLDKFDASTGGQYGNWIFFRRLTEKYPTLTGALPNIVREIWERADSVAPAVDNYSIQAVRNEIVQRSGASFAAYFTRYGADNRRSRTATIYNEGAANAYPIPPLAYSKTMSSTSPATGWRSVTTHHLTSRTVRVTPGSTIRSTAWRARIELDMVGTGRGSAATLVVARKNGTFTTVALKIDSTGYLRTTTGFSNQNVKYLELTLTNASAVYQGCFLVFTPYSCSGTPRDDSQVQKFRITAYRS